MPLALTPLMLTHPSIAPYGAFTTRDGNEIVISIQNEREWQQFCERFVRRPELGIDPRFVSNTQQVGNRGALDPMIAEAFAALDVATNALQRFYVQACGFF